MKKKIILNEANLNWFEQERKMDLWHNGGRGSAVKLMSDDKLKMNFDICKKKGYTVEANILQNEAVKRGLSWAALQNTNTNTNTQQIDTQPNADLHLTFNEDQFAIYLAKSVKKSSIEQLSSVLEAFESLKSQPGVREGSVFIYLIYAIILKCSQEKIDTIKDFLVQKFGMDIQTIKDNIRTVLSDSAIMEKINQITAEVLTESVEQKLDEKIVKKGNKYQVQSEKGRNMGTYGTEAEAKKRLQQIEYFKHINEDVEKHDTLNPKLWNEDNSLKQEVKEKINLIIEEFIDNLKENEITFNLKDTIIVGSNCSYNYNKDSDLDIHLVAENIEAPEDLYNKIYSAYRSIFNKKLDIEFYGIPVELFIETEDTHSVYNGIYSVLQDKWLQEPVAEDIPEIDQEAFEKEYKIWEDKYNSIVSESEKELNEEIENKQISDIDQFLEDVYALRKEDLASGNQYGIKNLVFKELRNKGYLDKLKDLKNELLSKELSLESLNIKEDLNSVKVWFDCPECGYRWEETFEKGYFEDEEDLENVMNYSTNECPECGCKDCFAKEAKILNEKMDERLRRQYFEKISQISYSQPFIQSSGLFNIYNIKEDDVDRIVRRIRSLDFIEFVNKHESGKYDFSKAVMFGQPQPKYYNITGKIKEEI